MQSSQACRACGFCHCCNSLSNRCCVWPADVPRFLEHFALFAPAFSRRPYFRESEGAIIVELDHLALAEKKITLSIDINIEEGE